MQAGVTMPFQVIRDGQPVAGSKFPTKIECAAFIIMKGWVDTVEKYGMVWAKGVTIEKVKPNGEA